MKVLAVETSSHVAAVAVMDSGALLGEYLLDHGKTHSQRLVPMTNELLSALELKPGDIDLFAASCGPGSFTGLRIGITTVKAMAFAAHKPAVGVPTLDALAYNIQSRGNVFICPVMDARNNQVYTALYSCEDGHFKNVTEYMGLAVEELVRLISGKNSDVVFTGDAAAIHEDFFKKELGERCSFAPPFLRCHRASSVAQLALLRASEGKLEDCYSLTPFYLRKSQAEREFERKQAAAAYQSGDMEVR